MQTPMAQSDRGNMLEEPGSEDNRMTVDPADPRWAKTIAAWSDGAKYNLKDVQIQQMAPGDFRILSFTVGTAPADEAEPTEEAPPEEAAEPTPAVSGYSNPAVQGLMDSEMKR